MGNLPTFRHGSTVTRDAIKQFVTEYQDTHGRAPTAKVVAGALGYHPHTVQKYFTTLQRAGRIVRRSWIVWL